MSSKLNTLNISEYNLLANKDPRGCYDRTTRENLYWIIDKLTAHQGKLSPLERRLHDKFRQANFSPLEDKDKKVKFEVRRYRLTNNAKQTLKLSASVLTLLITVGLTVYHLVLDAPAQKQVDLVFYQELEKLGLVSSENLEQIRTDLTVRTQELQRTKEGNRQLNAAIADMILNNKATENMEYILKQIYQDPKTRYVSRNSQVTLKFNNKEIASYKKDPNLWYLVGTLDGGILRVIYDEQEILKIKAIFGRTGEETPLGAYEIKNKVNKPTWYKKEIINGKTRVRQIPFGDPEHEIGSWWMGLRKLDKPVPGSYGIHGVNLAKVNEFYKKNFDWRNGSAGCPNIQAWYLDFLANVLPLGVRVDIVEKDKWKPGDARPVGSAA